MQQDHPDLTELVKASQQQALRFVLTQLFVTSILSILALLIFNNVVGYSSLAGGLIATLANTWFAVKVFRVKSKATEESVLATFYIGEIYKFIFTGAMFVIAFVLIKPLSAVALLAAYFLIHITPAVQNAFGR